VKKLRETFPLLWFSDRLLFEGRAMMFSEERTMRSVNEGVPDACFRLYIAEM
jgi:hypothetical protein